MIRLYRSLTTLAGPLITLYLRRRMALGKEDRQRYIERHGVASVARPPGRLVWLHAASMGEAVSMLPVVERLLADFQVQVLMTTGTVTSAELMARRLPAGAIHQYVPVDRVTWVRRFLDHWRPDLALWAESEFWPNLLSEVTARDVPVILLNGRMSDRSFARWRRTPKLIRHLLGLFSLCLAQTPEDARRLNALGAPAVRCAGNLKFAAPPLPIDEGRFTELVHMVGPRPCWLAASTHAGEESMAGRIHRRLAPAHPGLLTIIVPRHPVRSESIVAELAGLGLTVALRSRGDMLGRAADILVGDTLGEMGEFFRLSKIVFMGKSLTERGGHNPLEPARTGAAVLYGPHMGNFLDIATRMVDAGAASAVADEESLAVAVDRRLREPTLAIEDGARALAFANSEADVLDRVMAELQPWLRLPGVVHALP